MATRTLGKARSSDLWKAVWRVADPKITMASVASMLVGIGAAAHDGPIAWGWLGLTVLGIFCIEAAKNASGEIFDWESGADRRLLPEERTPFSGGKRILVDGLVSRGQAAGIADASYAVGIGAGLMIVLLREPNVLWLGMLGVFLAYFYHAPPLSLSYRGLGEAAVATAYGPVIATGTYLVQRGEIGADVLLGSVPLGIAIMAFLWINEMPDARADAAAGKRTLVVRLGRARASRVFALVVGAAYVTLLVLPLAGAPWTVWLGLIGLPLGVRAARRLRAHPDEPSEMVPAQAWTLQSFLLLALGTSVGWMLG